MNCLDPVTEVWATEQKKSKDVSITEIKSNKTNTMWIERKEKGDTRQP
jgi:hypothetical protein